ncbi:MAG: hypothetical protein WC450_09900 [Candidatus Omnitrophota bacterium]|jgi:hypothetical protein
MKIKVYARLDKDIMYGKGKAAGLSEEAANYFRYFEEIEIELHVDAENGAVCGAEITQKF